MAAGGEGKPEIYIEFVVQGALVKATAIDAKTGTEACIFGPASAGRDALSKGAVAKLAYVMKKQKGE